MEEDIRDMNSSTERSSSWHPRKFEEESKEEDEVDIGDNNNQKQQNNNSTSADRS